MTHLQVELADEQESNALCLFVCWCNVVGALISPLVPALELVMAVAVCC